MGKMTKLLSEIEHVMFGLLGRKIRLVLFSNKKTSIFATSYNSLDIVPRDVGDKILDDVHQGLATSILTI
jgi:hypothetical protein